MSRNIGSSKKARNSQRGSFLTERMQKRGSNVISIRPDKEENVRVANNKFKELKPLNFIQGEYAEAIRNNDIIFGVGSAGTGKTALAANYAAKELYYKRIKKIYITRPNVDAGPEFGFLPGEIEEKYLPYLKPFQNEFIKALGKPFYDYCIKSKDIEPVPLAFLRGDTFEDCIVLLDEAENCTKKDFFLFLSRIGQNCKVIISGDSQQVDIPDSGLDDAVKRLSHIPDIETVYFQISDIVRSEMCKKIVTAYQD